MAKPISREKYDSVILVFVGVASPLLSQPPYFITRSETLLKTPPTLRKKT
jgi:hypothetical protein